MELMGLQQIMRQKSPVIQARTGKVLNISKDVFLYSFESNI